MVVRSCVCLQSVVTLATNWIESDFGLSALAEPPW